jgi:hypothetical protein
MNTPGNGWGLQREAYSLAREERTKTSHSQFWGNSNEGTPYNPTYFTYEKLPITLCVILVFKQTCKYNEMGGTYYEFRQNTR